MKANRPLVYIAHPYTSEPLNNTRKSMDLWDQMLCDGFLPWNPLWSHYQHEFMPVGYQTWIDYDLDLLERIRPDAIYRARGPSAGADGEVAWAHDHGVPVFTSYRALLDAFPERTPIYHGDQPA